MSINATPETRSIHEISARHRAEHLFTGPIAEEYAMLQLICPAAAEMSQQVGETVAAWPGTPAGPFRLLEIGCGTGITTLNLLVRADLAITSVDNSTTMLEQARRNLAVPLAGQRLQLVEEDALSFLQGQPDHSYDGVASAYTLHNFLDPYRHSVLREILRVLKPGGRFVNGDRYGLDDTLEHLACIQEEARHYFRTFTAIGRTDLLEHWIIHLFSDESPDHVMRLTPALEAMQTLGFSGVEVAFRAGVNALVTGGKP